MYPLLIHKLLENSLILSMTLVSNFRRSNTIEFCEKRLRNRCISFPLKRLILVPSAVRNYELLLYGNIS